MQEREKEKQAAALMKEERKRIREKRRSEKITDKSKTYLPELKPLTGRTSRSMRRKAGDSSPERQESIHDTEASKRAGSKKQRPDLKPLTGRSRSMRRKAGNSSPERQESIDDTEASKRAGSKKQCPMIQRHPREQRLEASYWT
jgi:hypothetical protein